MADIRLTINGKECVAPEGSTILQAAERNGIHIIDLHKTVAKIDHDEKNGSDPDHLGRVIARNLLKKRMPASLLIASPDQKLAVLLHRLLPKKLFARILTLYYGGRFR